MNDILGEDNGSTDPLSSPDSASPVPAITEWSIQAAMLENVRRMSAAIVGDSPEGRVMAGLRLAGGGAFSCASGSYADNSVIKIDSGIGVTANGDVVMVGAQISVDISSKARGTAFYVYLEHSMATVVASDNPVEGMSTPMISGGPSQDIVYDDFASSKKISVNNFANDVIIIKASRTNSGDEVYLGSFTKSLTDTTITVIRTPNIGFSGIVTAIGGLFDPTIPFNVLGNVTIGGTHTVAGTATFTTIIVG